MLLGSRQHAAWGTLYGTEPLVSLTIFCLFLSCHAYLFIFTAGSAVAETV
jgi:hypothetical protein